jgi:hypothetical protein
MMIQSRLIRLASKSTEIASEKNSLSFLAGYPRFEGIVCRLAEHLARPLSVTLPEQQPKHGLIPLLSGEEGRDLCVTYTYAALELFVCGVSNKSPHGFG